MKLGEKLKNTIDELELFKAQVCEEIVLEVCEQ